MKAKALYIKKGNGKPFPNVYKPAKVSDWTYQADRMGGAPSITATLMHSMCLDSLWTRKEYVELDGEKYYVKQIPTSSKSNDDARYKHEISFVSERQILENIYFFDVVTEDTESQYGDRYRSNTTEFKFYGDIHEMVGRLNDSLVYSKLYDTTTKTGYRIVVDGDITTETKEVSFSDSYFTAALQEIYNTFGVPYYWVGKTCHVGYTENAISYPFEYGKDNGLISITKTNTNNRIVNRITGAGGSDNVPYYYPNDSADNLEVPPTGSIMPPVFVTSKGAERFYPAANNTYKDENGDFYVFPCEYSEDNPMEGIVNHEDIYPTIKDVTNASGQLIGVIEDVAFDDNDSDELEENGSENSMDYVHSYFYVKLRLFNGDYGFNLFKCALESGAMTLCMTSGNCASCQFEVGVSEPMLVEDHYEFDNPVQVDASGNIVAGDYAEKVNFNNLQEQQQDTTTNEVWIALKKENSTFGVVMPNATNNYKPNKGDTFVIKNISFPVVYIRNAEDRLMQALIKDMWESNRDKFTLSISFSRIYLEKHPDTAALLNENARLTVRYNDTDMLLYVTSFTRSVTDDILEEVSVELSEDLQMSDSGMAAKIAEAAKSAVSAITGDLPAMGSGQYLSKKQRDVAMALIRFAAGLTVGSGAYGIDAMGNAALNSATFGAGKIYKIDSSGAARMYRLIASYVQSPGYTPTMAGSGFSLREVGGESVLEVDRLMVRKKAEFEELEVKRRVCTSGTLSVGHAGNRIFAVRPIKIGQSEVEAETLFVVDGMAIAVDTTGVRLLGVSDGSEGADAGFLRCYFVMTDGEKNIGNDWRMGDLARCQTANLVEGISHNAANRYYWRLVTDTGSETLEDGKTYNYATLCNLPRVCRHGFTGTDGWHRYEDATNKLYTRYDKGDVYVSGESAWWCGSDGVTTTPDVSETGWNVISDTSSVVVADGYDRTVSNDLPQSGDDIVQEGAIDAYGAGRQGLILIDAEYGVSVYRGINTFSLAGKRRIIISPDEVDITANRFRIETKVDGKVTVTPIAVDKGKWQAQAYDYYDRVSHNGSLWLCVSETGASAGDEPVNGSAVWELQVASGAAASMVWWQLDKSLDYWMADGNGNLLTSDSVTLTLYRVEGDSKAATPFTLDVTYHYADGTGKTLQKEGASSYTITIEDKEKAEMTYAEFGATAGGKVVATTAIPMMRNGKDGESGSVKGMTLYLQPQNSIINQSIDGVIELTGVETTVRAMLGTTDISGDFNVKSLSTSNPILEVGKYVNSNGHNVIRCNSLDISSEQPTHLQVYITVQYLGETNYSLTWDIYINYMGTFKESIMADVKEQIAEKTTVEMDGENVAVTEAISRIRQSADEISAEVAAVKTTAEGNSSAISTLRQTANSLTSRVTTIEGAGYMTESEVEQTAERISMRVQNQSVGRRNLLKGSQLYKREHVFGYLTSELIATNKGYNMLATQSSTSENYSGLFWRWDKGGNIKIEKGKTYFASVEIMTYGSPGQDYQGYIESYYHANAVESDRHGSPSMARNRWYIDTPGEWTLFTAKMTIPDDAEYEYIECNFICVAINDTTNPVFYFRKPMLEEADSYAGWTLSEEDYDYTGGNLLDGTRELVVTGNLTENSGTYTDGVDGCAATILTAGPACLEWDLSGLDLSGDELVLSFLAKGSANSSSTSELKISANLGGSATVTVEGTGKENDFTTSSGGNISLAISPTWQRYWVHWHVKSGSPTAINISASNSDSDPVVCQPKLEIGAHATGWIEGGDDLVDKRTLLATGIDIENKKITLTADKTQLLDNSGRVIAVFSADGTLINSDLVDVAGAIRAKTIDCGEATFTNVTVSGVLKGVTGTFKRLDAVDGSGAVKGSLVFNSDGELGVNSDFYIGSRGFGQSIGRNMTIPDNIICQGLFGTSQLAMAVVIAGTMRIYNKGIQQATDIASNYMAVNLMSYTYGGARYYDIPLLYHIEGYKISRYFPINLVVFKGNTTYNYSLASEIGKHVILVNANNGVAQNIAHVGGWFGMAGGACAHAILLHDSLMYQTSSFTPGKNTFIAGYHDNNWT